MHLLLNEKIIKKAIEDYISLGKSSALINRVLSGIQIFFNWCSDEDQQYIDKKDYIKKYKQQSIKTIRAPYTEEEYNMILDYFTNKVVNKEFCYFIQFLWHTGARAGEALNIMGEDIDFKNMYIRIPNKIFKGQQETLLLSDTAFNILWEHIKYHAINIEDKVFSWKDTTLPYRILHRAERKLGIRIKGRGLHGFRRSFADKLFKNEFAVDRVQEIMRHRNIQTTIDHYKNFNKRNVIKEMNEKLK